MKIALILSLLLFQANASKRVLTIYAKDATEKTYLEQLRILNADPEGLKERDVVIVPILKSPSFKILLTGKDGHKKYSADKILTLSKLYAIIDAMPMRKEEMLKQDKTPAPK